MLIGAIGHGCYSVVVDKAHVLIDPLLTPTFLGGTSEPYPRRDVDLATLPTVDAIFISHSHPGHLEPDTLDLLPRDIPVFAPSDPTIEFVMAKMGFALQAVRPNTVISVGAGSIGFVGAGTGGGYLSAVFDDDDGRCWYLGDRGDFLPMAVINAVTARRAVDVAIVSHPSDYHSYLQNSTWAGGAQDGESHAQWLGRSLQVAREINAGLTVPGSTSNRYIDGAAWLNRYVFPMRPAEFVREFARVAPESAATALNPGDVVRVVAQEATIERDAMPGVVPRPDEDDRGVDPTLGAPDVVDTDPEHVGREVLRQRCEAYLSGPLADWAANRSGSCAAELGRMHRLGLRYRVTAVFEDASTATWRLALHNGDVTVDLVPPTLAPDYGERHLRIAASTLDRWSRNVIAYFEASPDCRRGGEKYSVAVHPDGTVVAAKVDIRDLVTMHLTSSVELHHQWLARRYWPDDE